MINCSSCWCSSTIHSWVSEIPVYCLCHNTARLLSPAFLLDFHLSHFSFFFILVVLLKSSSWPVDFVAWYFHYWLQTWTSYKFVRLFYQSLDTNGCQKYPCKKAVAVCIQFVYIAHTVYILFLLFSRVARAMLFIRKTCGQHLDKKFLIYENFLCSVYLGTNTQFLAQRLLRVFIYFCIIIYCLEFQKLHLKKNFYVGKTFLC